jgi:hypothetical protein
MWAGAVGTVVDPLNGVGRRNAVGGPHLETIMNRTVALGSVVIAAAVALSAVSAGAQVRGGSRPAGGGGGGRVASAPSVPRTMSAQPRFGAARSAPAMPSSFRGSAGGRTFSAPQARSFGSAQNRTFGPAPSRSISPAQGRTYTGSSAVTRPSPGTALARPQSFAGRPGGAAYEAPHAIPRGGTGYRGGSDYRYGGYDRHYGGFDHDRSYYGGHGYYGHPTMVRPYFSRAYVRPWGWHPYYPYRFARPYYVFSPWLDLGFGIWVGYPVSYPWVYLGDYRPTVFGACVSCGYSVTPMPLPASTQPDYGGVSFDVQPADANLFIDGQYVGVVGSFGPAAEPLTLAPGTHRIAIQRDGYRPIEWDVTVQAGQVIPYRGVLERQW